MKLSRLILLVVLATAACATLRNSTELERAEELSRQGLYDEAISAYRKHMENRLAINERPAWENPYFYLILIGDIQLGQEKAEAALATVYEASEKGVEASLVNDRLRAIAHWHEQKGHLKEALKILEANRTRDPLLFDIMLDRIARRLSAEEDAAREVGPEIVDQKSTNSSSLNAHFDDSRPGS